MKLYMLVYTLLTTSLYTNLLPTPNFDLINEDPKIPIHVSANGGPWQTLNQQHYRYPIEVPENSLLVMSLSANDDKSASISLIFAPERALDVAKQVGSKITKAPTFYVTASIVDEKVTGSDKTIKHVQLKPQISNGTGNKTKSGLSLENNVTQEMIDAIVGIATSETSEPTEYQESESIETKEILIEHNTTPTIKEVQQPAMQPVQASAPKPVEPIQIKNPEPPVLPEKAQVVGPTNQTTPLQHTDTPQMVLATLKNMTNSKKHADKLAQWVDVRNYLTNQQAKELFKDHDDAYIYNQLVEHYQILAGKTKSNLKKVYRRIIEIVTKTYKVAHP